MFLKEMMSSPRSLADALRVPPARVALAPVGPAPSVGVAGVVGEAAADGAVQPGGAGGVLPARAGAAGVAQVAGGSGLGARAAGDHGARARPADRARGRRRARAAHADVGAAQAVVQGVHDRPVLCRRNV